MGQFDPAGIAVRLVTAGLFDRYVVYERRGSWWVAGGQLGSVELYRDAVRTVWPGARVATTRVGRGHLADELAAALHAMPLARWRAYGWVAFEFALAAAGRPLADPDQRLAHVVVPLAEVKIRSDAVDVRCSDGPLLTRILHLVTTPAPVVLRAPCPLDVEAVDPESYLGAVEATVRRIRRGELEKVILSRRLAVPFDVDFAGTYRLGRAAHTPARSFLLDLPGLRAAGFSPEILAEVTSAGWVTTQPLAGTRERTGDERVDVGNQMDLRTDPKEIYEHAVSVKLADAELRTICAAATVSVRDFMSIKSRGSVHHLGSCVRGRLRAGRSGWDALAVLFPAVTASGIPKAPAYDAIAAYERTPRGLYSGAILRASYDGSLDAALVLRTVYTQDGAAWLRAGAGIVAASEPAREYRETCEKLASVAPYLVPAAREPAPP